jgi:hypothetical protein
LPDLDLVNGHASNVKGIRARVNTRSPCLFHHSSWFWGP